MNIGVQVKGFFERPAGEGRRGSGAAGVFWPMRAGGDTPELRRVDNSSDQRGRITTEEKGAGWPGNEKDGATGTGRF